MTWFRVVFLVGLMHFTTWFIARAIAGALVALMCWAACHLVLWMFSIPDPILFGQMPLTGLSAFFGFMLPSAEVTRRSK